MNLNYVDLYVKSIALKYPLIFPNQKKQGMKTLDKLNMMKRMVQLNREKNEDYMGERVTNMVLNKYFDRPQNDFID